MANLIVHGSYFSVNFGDLLLVEIARSLVRSADLTPLLLNPSQRVKNALIADNGVSSPQEISLTKGLLFAGGGYLGAANSNAVAWGYRNLMRHGRALRIATKAPSYFYGIGFGPLPDGRYRELSMKALNFARFIAFRDVESLRLYRDYGGTNDAVEVIADAATLISLSKDAISIDGEFYCDLPQRPSSLPKAIFHIESGHSDDQFRAICEGVSRAATAMSKEYEICFISDGIARWRETKQMAIARKLAKAIKGARVIKFSSCKELMQELAAAEVILTTKLHVGIVGAALGKNVISLPHHSKVERFYSQIGESRRVLGGVRGAREVHDFVINLVNKKEAILLNDELTNSASAARRKIVELIKEV